MDCGTIRTDAESSGNGPLNVPWSYYVRIYALQYSVVVGETCSLEIVGGPENVGLARSTQFSIPCTDDCHPRVLRRVRAVDYPSE